MGDLPEVGRFGSKKNQKDLEERGKENEEKNFIINDNDSISCWNDGMWKR